MERLETMEGFQAHVWGIKSKRGPEEFNVPINVSDLVDVDRIKGEVYTDRVTLAELIARRPSLDIDPNEEGVEIGYNFRYNSPNRHLGKPERDENAAYSADPDGIGRYGWRKPGMHKRRAPKDGPILTHGPGKRNKGKRK